MTTVHLNSPFKSKTLGRGPGGGLCVVLLKKIFYSHTTVKPILTNHSLVSWNRASRKNRREENGERSFMRAVPPRCVSPLVFRASFSVLRQTKYRPERGQNLY